MVSALNDFTILLLIAHYLGDYQLQWEALAEEKTRKASGMLKHLSIHFLLLVALFVWGLCQGLGVTLLWPVLIVFGVHVLVDVFKKQINRKPWAQSTHNAKVAIYLADQVLHLVAILLVGQWFFADACKAFSLGSLLTREMLNWALLLLLIGKPANVSFKVLFEKYQYKEPAEPQIDNETEHDATTNFSESDIERVSAGLDLNQMPAKKANAPKEAPENLQTVAGAGAIIGNMERFLSAIFLATGQWAAIGVIFTAKSIARFKQIEKNKQFAEYYLIGTLYSILYVVVVFFLLIGFKSK
ncbi:MAG TPA: DUF3307 domain-containing protein [Anaerolineaceae bacterium]|nr:DUF3307 domain-containing protein [Anaerolineaceae bacterium]